MTLCNRSRVRRFGFVGPVGVALTTLVVMVAFAGTAGATDLTPDSSGADPNGAPPPPPPMPEPGTVGSPTAPPPAGSTAAVLQQASDEDTGVGLHLFYLQPELGFGVANLGSSTTGRDLGTTSGPAIGFGAGAEFITFQLGGRLRNIFTPNFDLWSLGGELNYQPGSGKFWPRLGLSVGYAWVNHWSTDYCGASCALVDVHGIDVGARGGFQYFVTSSLEVGADAGIDALFLKRPSINTLDPNFSGDGSGTGFSAVAMVHLGLHLP